MSKFIKITYESMLGEKINFCIGNPASMEELRSKISNYLFKHLKMQSFEFGLYWIDNDGDIIYLFEYSDYEIFSLSNSRHLYVCDTENIKSANLQEDAATSSTNQNPQQTTTESPNQNTNYQNDSFKKVHEGVICDSCSMSPIVGFRYKCLICPNFDLCGTCDAAHEHSNHVMLRIPNDIGGTRVYECLLRGKFSKYRDENSNKSGRERSGKERHGRERNHRHGRHGRSFTPIIFPFLSNIEDGGDFNESNEPEVPKTSSSQNVNQSPKASPQKNNETTSNSNAANIDQFKAADLFVATLAAENAAAIVSKVAESATNAIFGITKEPFLSSSETANAEKTSTSTANNSSDGGAAKTTEANENGENKKSSPTTPSLDFHNLMNFVDPRFVRNGIQILNNFSDMFAKMLDPIDGDGCNFPTSNSNSRNSSRKDSDSSDSTPFAFAANGTKDVTTSTVPTKTSEVGTATPTTKTSDVSTATTKTSTSEVATATLIAPTSEVGTATTNTLTSEASTATNNTITTEVATATSSVVDSGVNTEVDVSAAPLNDHVDGILETDSLLGKDSLNSTAEDVTQNLPRSQSEENDWQFINNESFVNPNTPSFLELNHEIQLMKKKFDASTITIQDVTTQETNTDKTSTSTVGTNTQATTTTTSATSAKAAKANPTTVFHEDPVINRSVIAMMAMGFSNEGAWLTHLLESVHGNIPEALDIMNIAQQQQNNA